MTDIHQFAPGSDSPGATSVGAKGSTRLSAERVCWDLSDLFESPEDPSLAKTEQDAVTAAEEFVHRYRDRIAVPSGPSPELIAQALRDYERVLDLTYRVVSYTRLLHSADSNNSRHGALLARSEELLTKVRTTVMFFELDWIALDDDLAAKIVEGPSCARWKHFLTGIRRYKPHTLSEAEEIILAEKSSTGATAFRRLFDETTSAAVYEVELEGRTQSMSQSETLALLHHSDRAVRQAAHAGFTRGLEKDSRLTTFVFNTLLRDHAVNSRLKDYDDPAASRHLANEIQRETVDALVSACEDRICIVKDYYRLKSRLLGISPLYDYDRYAPVEIKGATIPRCNWDQACQVVRDSYSEFSPSLGAIVDEFFSGHWVDAGPRSGKRGGAFCSSTVPSVHPYILMNYTDKLNDVMTLAHELGHGVHQRLAQPQGILQQTTPLTLAETASVFGEMLVFDGLLKQQADPKVKLALLCHKLESSVATVFRQIVLTRFEQSIHRSRAEGELSTEDLDRLWLEVNAPMHGSAVELTDGYKRWWSYIPHFVHAPFYCYAYSFGELLVLTLWNQYQRQGASFVPKYLQLLKAGGSDTPARLIARMGLNIDDPQFWSSGLEVLEQLLSEAQSLADEIS